MRKFYWVERENGYVVFVGSGSRRYYKRHGGCRAGLRLSYTTTQAHRPKVGDIAGAIRFPATA